MLVMDAIAQILKREGISTLFCFPTTPIIEAAVAAGLRPIICRQERVGVDMANGFARTTNGQPPGVFAMQYGPGAENAFPGIATRLFRFRPRCCSCRWVIRATRRSSFRCSSRRRTYRVGHQAVEQLTLPDQVGPAMRRAFSQLKNGRLGPVMLEVPARCAEGRPRHGHRSPTSPSGRRDRAAIPRDVDEAAQAAARGRRR